MKQVANLILLCNISIILLSSFVLCKEISYRPSKLKEIFNEDTKKTEDLLESKINENNGKHFYNLDINFKDRIKEAEEMLYSQLTNTDSLMNNLKKRKKVTASKDIQTNTATNIVSNIALNIESNSASNVAAINIAASKENIESKNNYKDNSSSITAFYKLISLDTEITLNNEKAYGEVFEKAKFELNKGVFTSIIRKFSLTGSSDSMIAYKLTSKDVKIKEARIISNCLESGEQDPSLGKPEEYVCVIGIFEEINAKDQNKIIEIDYKYVANNLLRLKDSENGKSNTILWVYDNIKRNHAIENIKLKINFENNEAVAKFKKEQFQGEPNNFTHEVKSNYKDSVISWEIPNIRENEIIKVLMDISVFNTECRTLYDFDMEKISYSIAQYLLWILVSIIFIFMSAFIYSNEKEKHDSLKLCEEENFLKAFQDKEEKNQLEHQQ